MPPPNSTSQDPAWPPLSLAGWRETCATLHMWTQVVGKTRLALAPMENHWWGCTLYVSERGLTTTPMPDGARLLTVEFDFIDHLLVLRTDGGDMRRCPWFPRPWLTSTRRYLQALHGLGFAPQLLARPVEVQEAIPFAEDEAHAAYDRDAVHRCWRAMVQVDRVFKRFRTRLPWQGRARCTSSGAASTWP